MRKIKTIVLIILIIITFCSCGFQLMPTEVDNNTDRRDTTVSVRDTLNDIQPLKNI